MSNFDKVNLLAERTSRVPPVIFLSVSAKQPTSGSSLVPFEPFNVFKFSNLFSNFAPDI